MCGGSSLWILKILRIWHVPMLKSLDYADFKNLECAEAHSRFEFNDFKKIASAYAQVVGFQ